MHEYPPFGCETRKLGDAVLMLVSGECDFLNSPLIEERVQDVVRSDCRDLVVDLTETCFVDSSTLRVLFLAKSRMAEKGGGVCLVPSHELFRLLAIVGADRAFRLAASVAEAFAGSCATVEGRT